MGRNFDFEPRTLTHFLAVYENGCFSRAADHVSLTQPALSNSIQQLEKRLGVKLFERGARGVKPTVYGDSFYQRTKIVRAELQSALEEIHALQECSVGAVNIGVGPSVLDIITRVIQKTITAHPTLKITLTEGPEETLYSGIRSGELDLVISTVSKKEAESELSHEIVFTNPTVPIVRKGHPLLKSRATGWAALKKYPWVVADMQLEPGGKDIFSALSKSQPPSMITTNSSAFMKTLASNSDFVAFMPHTLASSGGFEGRLEIVGAKKGLYRTDIGITSRTNSFLSPAGKLVIDEFRLICRELKLKPF